MVFHKRFCTLAFLHKMHNHIFMKKNWVRLVTGASIILIILAFNPLLNPFLYFDSKEEFFFNSQIKVFLLAALNTFLLFYWAFTARNKKEMHVTPTRFYWVLGLYLLSLTVSSFYSISQENSLLGFVGTFSGSFLEILNIVVLFVLILNLFKSKEDVFFFARVLMLGGAFASLWILVRHSISWEAGNIFFSNYLNYLRFSPTGALNSLIPVLLAAFIIAMIILFYTLSQKKFNKYILAFDISTLILTGMGLVNLLNLQSDNLNWFIIVIGIAALLYILYTTLNSKDLKQYKFHYLAIIVLTIGLGIVVYFINTKETLERAIRPTLSLNESWKISQESLNGSFMRSLFGNGSGNYVYIFDLFKSEPLALDTNSSVDAGKLPFTNVNSNYPDIVEKRSVHADSYLIEILSNYGWVGILVFLTMVAYAFMLYFKNKDKSDFLLTGLFLAFGILVLSMFKTGYDFTFFLYFWIILALGFAYLYKDQKQKNLIFAFQESGERKSTSLSFFIPVLLSIISISAFVFALRLMAANASAFWAKRFEYLAALELQAGNEEGFYQYLLRYQESAADAVNTFDKSDVFIRELVYSNYQPVILETVKLLPGSDAELTEEQQQDLINKITYLNNVGNGILTNLDFAIRLYPYEYKNYYLKASLLDSLSTYTGNQLDSVAINNYERANILNTHNYSINYTLSNLYKRNGNFTAALNYLNLATRNLPLTSLNVLQAQLNYAEIYEGLDDKETAISIYESLIAQDLSSLFVSEEYSRFQDEIKSRIEKLKVTDEPADVDEGPTDPVAD